MLYRSWDMVHDKMQLFFILGHFLPFYCTNKPKNQNEKKKRKKKKTPGDMISLHKCNKNHDHML